MKLDKLGFSPKPVAVMPQVETGSLQSLVRRAIEFWPYLFLVVSVTGLAYIALTEVR